jgi:DNA-binding HxlR family transcriptional regulator
VALPDAFDNEPVGALDGRVKQYLQDTFGCPVELAIELIGGKWTTVLLAHLKESPRRYAELRRLVPRISDKMLTQRLQELMDKDLVQRSPVDGAASYQLTPRGESLRPVLDLLYAWGEQQARELGARVERMDRGEEAATPPVMLALEPAWTTSRRR